MISYLSDRTLPVFSIEIVASSVWVGASRVSSGIGKGVAQFPQNLVLLGLSK